MKKLIVLAIALILTGCSVTITRTTMNITNSTGVTIEFLQEQKSDTQAETSAKVGAI